MGLEKGLLDKIINKGLLSKRQIGRPLKSNIVTKEGRGVLEMMYQPRNQFEQVLGGVIHGFMPLMSYFTYKFHVERARDAGMRVEDTYHQKFFREPYITWHIYAQHFHPHTLHERVRSVNFYRKVKTLYKGFKVPDWAHDHKKDGWDIDAYSRSAWDGAMKDFNSEWTPMPWTGERLEPNVINWFRIEQLGKGFSSRYFYNETPKPQWHRHGGHLDDKEKTLYSFKYGDQHHEDVLGFDVSTTEGKKALDSEVKRWKEMTPEVYDSMGIPEGDDTWNNRKYVSTEPHFQRALTHYRAYALDQKIHQAIDNGVLDESDYHSAKKFFDERGLPSASLMSMGAKGLFGEDESFESFKRVLSAVGLGDFDFSTTTSEPLEEQLQRHFDDVFDVKQADLNKALPLIISNPRERARVEALLESGENGLPQEHSRHLA
jgi:hypothetical protein